MDTFLTEREYYQVEIQVSPPQEIESRVTFKCTAMPQIYQNFTLPLRYQWYFPDRGSSYSRSTNTQTYTITSSEQTGNYYCLVYSRNSNNLLGQRRTKLNIEGIILLFYLTIRLSCHCAIIYDII